MFGTRCLDVHAGVPVPQRPARPHLRRALAYFDTSSSDDIRAGLSDDRVRVSWLSCCTVHLKQTVGSDALQLHGVDTEDHGAARQPCFGSGHHRRGTDGGLLLLQRPVDRHSGHFVRGMQCHATVVGLPFARLCLRRVETHTIPRHRVRPDWMWRCCSSRARSRRLHG